MPNATFNGITIGDHAWLEPTTSNIVEIHRIPRADGAIIRPKGGGVKTMRVHSWIVLADRVTLEQYMDGLAANFGSGIADLILNGETYSNCILQDITPDGRHNRFSNFTITFIKSGD